jgi:dCMP deaminase
LHAEQNAIIQAAFHGIRIQGATLYCTNLPCSICAKMIINAGIQEIVYECGYEDELARQMLREAKISVRPAGGKKPLGLGSINPKTKLKKRPSSLPT